MSKIEVKTIEIVVGKKVVSLSPEELRELRDVLDATFPTGKPVQYVFPSPIYIERPVYPHRWDYWQPWYSTSGNTLRLSTTTDNAVTPGNDWQSLAK